MAISDYFLFAFCFSSPPLLLYYLRPFLILFSVSPPLPRCSVVNPFPPPPPPALLRDLRRALLQYPEGTYATRPARDYPSELPVVALRRNRRVSADAPAARDHRPMSVESVNRALAGDRLLFLSLQTNDDDEPRARRSEDGSAPSPPSGRWPRSPTAASTSSSKAWRARAPELVTRRPARRCAPRSTPLPEQLERTLEVDAYVRRLQELIERALSVAERAVAGTARRWSPASTIRCGSPICCRACST